MLVLVLVAVFAPAFWHPMDHASRPALSLQPPSREFLMGTDNIGRDMFSLVLISARASLLIGVTAALAALLVGGTVGMLAGYWRGATEAVLMRLAELFQISCR